MSDNIQLAYLAGYFDRCACLTVSKEYFPMVIVSSTNLGIIETIQQMLKTVGLPGGHIKTFNERKVSRTRFQLMLDGNESVARILNALRPYFRIRAREADLLLEIIEINEGARGVEQRLERTKLFYKLRGEKQRRGTLRQHDVVLAE